jgi:hypothetical protein
MFQGVLPSSRDAGLSDNSRYKVSRRCQKERRKLLVSVAVTSFDSGAAEQILAKICARSSTMLSSHYFLVTCGRHLSSLKPFQAYVVVARKCVGCRHFPPHRARIVPSENGTQNENHDGHPPKRAVDFC